MAERMEVYKCEICGNVIEVLQGAHGTLFCCGQPMKLMKESTEDTGMEKHKPVLEFKGDELHVSVGQVSHPMEQGHFIGWIEVVSGDEVKRQYLKPGGEPKAVFPVKGKDVTVRSWCNLHGLWKS